MRLNSSASPAVRETHAAEASPGPGTAVRGARGRGAERGLKCRPFGERSQCLFNQHSKIINLALYS